MGDWLQTLAPWDVFSTWTFSKPITAKGAMYWSRRHVEQLEDQVNGWGFASPSSRNGWGYLDMPQASLPRKRVHAFVALEFGNVGGLVHVHALVGNVGHLNPYCGHRLASDAWGRRCCMLHSWPCGYARVYPYDPKLGAAHYVGKYITKKLSEWDLIGIPQKILDRAATAV